jgi:hypothetical protein
MFRLSTTHYKKKIPAVVRKQVWRNYAHNNGILLCKCCEKEIITPFDFHCAHVVAEAKGGSIDINNLLPACKLCNQSMGTNNFFVFKSKLHSQIHYDTKNLSPKQIKIIQSYNSMSKNLTINSYYQNFYKLAHVVSKCMEVDVTYEDNCYKNSIKCKCGYKFVYVTHDNDFSLTCKENKQNLLDVICDHLPCLINNETFIEESNVFLK